MVSLEELKKAYIEAYKNLDKYETMIDTHLRQCIKDSPLSNTFNFQVSSTLLPKAAVDAVEHKYKKEGWQLVTHYYPTIHMSVLQPAKFQKACMVEIQKTATLPEVVAEKKRQVKLTS